MHERIIPVRPPAGDMETFITQPEEGGPFPPVVIYMDFWGVREELFDIARRVGTVGYYCMVPDLYYRQGRVRNEWRNEQNQMISMHRLDPERQRQALAPLQQRSNSMVIEDTGARHVLCAAGAYPERFIAGASLHGTTLVSDREDSPHRLADRFRGELYCGFAEHDPYATPDIMEELAGLLAPGPVRYRYEIHPGAEHGYALPNRDIHDKRAANRDWELIFAMFRRQIPPA